MMAFMCHVLSLSITSLWNFVYILLIPHFPLCHAHFLYAAVHEVVSHPPTQEFMAGIILQMSATPVSKIPGSMATHQSPPIDIPVSQQQLQSQQPAVSMESSTSSFSNTEYSLLASQSSEGVHQPEKWATPVAHCPSPIPKPRRAPSPGVPMFVQQGHATHLLGK